MVDISTWPTARQDAGETEWSTMESLRWRDGIHLNAPGLQDFLPFADSSGMNMKVSSGAAVLGGFFGTIATQTTFTVPAADASNGRIDRVVLQLDRTSPATISLEYLTGTPAASPIAPSLTNNATFTQLRIAAISVPNAAGTILPGYVTDERVDFTEDRLLGTVSPTNIDGGPTSAGNSGRPADAFHRHRVDVFGVAALVIPAGVILPYGAGYDTMPIGWLPADGGVHPNALYPELWRVYGGRYGGDGVTTFGVPNLGGKWMTGPSTSRGTTLGATEGNDGAANVYSGSGVAIGVYSQYLIVNHIVKAH